MHRHVPSTHENDDEANEGLSIIPLYIGTAENWLRSCESCDQQD